MIYKPERQKNKSFKAYQDRRRSMKLKLKRHKAGEMLYPVTELIQMFDENRTVTVTRKRTLNRSFVGDVRQTFKLK